MEKLIFPVSVTQKEQLSGVFLFEFNFDANLRHPNTGSPQKLLKICPWLICVQNSSFCLLDKNLCFLTRPKEFQIKQINFCMCEKNSSLYSIPK